MNSKVCNYYNTVYARSVIVTLKYVMNVSSLLLALATHTLQKTVHFSCCIIRVHTHHKTVPPTHTSLFSGRRHAAIALLLQRAQCYQKLTHVPHSVLSHGPAVPCCISPSLPSSVSPSLIHSKYGRDGEMQQVTADP